MNDKLKKVFSLVLKANDNGNTTFFGYYPHANSINVEIYDGNWQPIKEHKRFNIFLDIAGSEIQYEELIAELRKAAGE